MVRATGECALPTEQALDAERRCIDNVPGQLTPLLGRDDELVDLCTLLRQPDVRLLTLIETGGVGKTRLALAVANALLNDFPDGVCFVPLAPVSDPELVMPTIVRTFGLREETDSSPQEQLQSYLRDRQLLLVLDNFEQVVSAASQIAELLMACPFLRLLVTSRFALHLTGEYECSVAPLAVPDLALLPTYEDLAETPAVALFLQRTQTIQQSFQLTQQNARSIAEICQRLEGLPLAIELAAARIKLLPPQALLKRLERRLQVLTGGASDLPVRHQTLRNTLQWSYDLLNPHEQRLFRHLSVFVGGFTLQAVETFYTFLDGEGAGDAVLDGLASLIEKNLLRSPTHDEEDPRLNMLETIREFGWECLMANGELEATQDAHARCFLALVEEAAPHIFSPQETVWVPRLEREMGNLQAVMAWSLAYGRRTQNMEIALRLGIALENFWQYTGYFRDGWLFLEQALTGNENVETRIRANAFRLACILTNYLNDECAESMAEQSLVLFRELDDTPNVAFILRRLGWQAHMRYDFERANMLYQESLTLYRALNDREGTHQILFNIAYLAENEGDYTRARALFAEILAYHRETGFKTMIASTLSHIAQLLYLSLAPPPLKEIQAMLDEALVFAGEAGDRTSAASIYLRMAWVAFLRGDLEKAFQLTNDSIQFCKQAGRQQIIDFALELLARINMSQGHYAEARAHLEESFTSASKRNDVECISDLLRDLAHLALTQQQYARAARVLGAEERLREDTRTFPYPRDRSDYDGDVAVARAFLGQKPFATLWVEGRAMSPAEAFAAHDDAIKDIQQAQPVVLARAPAYPAGLTVREVEVLRLVAHGLTDTQIADQLVLSRRTVTTHLTSIYNKLDVSSRAAATRYAVEHHLL